MYRSVIFHLAYFHDQNNIFQIKNPSSTLVLRLELFKTIPLQKKELFLYNFRSFSK